MINREIVYERNLTGSFMKIAAGIHAGLDEKLMFRLIRASFNQRRKTLANGLSNSSELRLQKEQIADAIKSLGVSPSIRGEALTLEQFAQLSNYFTKDNSGVKK